MNQVNPTLMSSDSQVFHTLEPVKLLFNSKVLEDFILGKNNVGFKQI